MSFETASTQLQRRIEMSSWTHAEFHGFQYHDEIWDAALFHVNTPFDIAKDHGRVQAIFMDEIDQHIVMRMWRNRRRISRVDINVVDGAAKRLSCVSSNPTLLARPPTALALNRDTAMTCTGSHPSPQCCRQHQAQATASAPELGYLGSPWKA